MPSACALTWMRGGHWWGCLRLHRVVEVTGLTDESGAPRLVLAWQAHGFYGSALLARVGRKSRDECGARRRQLGLRLS